MIVILKINMIIIPIVQQRQQHVVALLHTKSQAALAVGRIITLMQTQQLVVIGMGMSL